MTGRTSVSAASGTFSLIQFGWLAACRTLLAFPAPTPAEWFVIDLLEHAEQAGASRADLGRSLVQSVAQGRFDRERLRAMASRFGTHETRRLVDVALRERAA